MGNGTMECKHPITQTLEVLMIFTAFALTKKQKLKYMAKQCTEVGFTSFYYS